VYTSAVFLLLPSALACTLTLHPDERGAFFAALALEIPEDSTLAADGDFLSWRETGKSGALERAAAGYAEAAGEAGTPEEARAQVMSIMLREALGELTPWRGASRLKGQPIYDCVIYEIARNKGACGGYIGFEKLSFPDDHPLAIFERMGEAISGWGWAVPTWDVALEAHRLAVVSGQVELAAELDALAVQIFADTAADESLPDFLDARCGGDAVCAAAQAAAIQAER
jgi:hypothetical protein